MKFLLKMLVFTLLAMPFSGMDSHAQSTKQQIEELKQQIEAIQRQNQQQIQQLQQQIELMENQRAADSEKMAEVVEKDQDSWYNKFKAKYDKGLTFSTEDGKFKMKFGIRGQFLASVNRQDSADATKTDPQTATNFQVKRLRLKWTGHAFEPWFLYTVQVNITDDLDLRDMYFTAAYTNTLAPRVGQWKVPFGRDELTSSSSFQFVDRSIINDEFGLGRDRGVALLGGAGPKYNFSYSGGVFNGDGRNGTSVDSNLLYAGRLQFGIGGQGDKFKANSSFATGSAYSITPNFAKSPTLVLGAGIATLPGLNCDRKSPDNDVCDRMQGPLGITTADYTTWTADINYKMPIFNVQGSYYGRWLNPDDSTQDTAYDQGFNVQAGVFVMPKTLEFAGRFSLLDYDTAGGVLPSDAGSVQDTSWAITPGINYYISHDHRWKIQLDYSFQRDTFTQGGDDVDDNLIRAQLQASF